MSDGRHCSICCWPLDFVRAWCLGHPDDLWDVVRFAACIYRRKSVMDSQKAANAEEEEAWEAWKKKEKAAAEAWRVWLAASAASLAASLAAEAEADCRHWYGCSTGRFAMCPSCNRRAEASRRAKATGGE
jgi:hypothetical protein